MVYEQVLIPVQFEAMVDGELQAAKEKYMFSLYLIQMSTWNNSVLRLRNDNGRDLQVRYVSVDENRIVSS